MYRLLFLPSLFFIFKSICHIYFHKVWSLSLGRMFANNFQIHNLLLFLNSEFYRYTNEVLHLLGIDILRSYSILCLLLLGQ